MDPAIIAQPSKYPSWIWLMVTDVVSATAALTRTAIEADLTYRWAMNPIRTAPARRIPQTVNPVKVSEPRMAPNYM